MLRLSNRVMFLVVCFLLVPPNFRSGYGTTGVISREDQLSFVAPTSSGETGLFTIITGDTLRRGDLSLGIYYQGWRLLAAPARDFAPLSARGYKDMSYNLMRASASVGFGLTDRWEISGAIPWDTVSNKGADRAGYINGWLYRGRFSTAASATCIWPRSSA